LTCIIKTAQGSSTVAIVTASSIILPLLPALGLDSENGRILAVLSMGAGSMMVSHTNDAYFWVISKFSDIDIKTMLRVHSIASVWMGLITMVVVYLLSLFMK
jgi:GntP family gluconate:H+ symporter